MVYLKVFVFWVGWQWNAKQTKIIRQKTGRRDVVARYELDNSRMITVSLNEIWRHRSLFPFWHTEGVPTLKLYYAHPFPVLTILSHWHLSAANGYFSERHHHRLFAKKKANCTRQWMCCHCLRVKGCITTWSVSWCLVSGRQQWVIRFYRGMNCDRTHWWRTAAAAWGYTVVLLVGLQREFWQVHTNKRSLKTQNTPFVAVVVVTDSTAAVAFVTVVFKDCSVMITDLWRGRGCKSHLFLSDFECPNSSTFVDSSMDDDETETIHFVHRHEIGNDDGEWTRINTCCFLRIKICDFFCL